MSLVQHATDVWSTEQQIAWPAGLIPIPVRMTVIRLRDGQLILHSPVPISSELRKDLDALGRVDFIVVPQAHGRFAAQASQSFPDAQLLAAPGAPARRESLRFHASLADQPPAGWEGQVESLLRWDFERVLPGHGDVIEHGARAALRMAWLS